MVPSGKYLKIHYFNGGYFKIAVNLNLKFHIKKSVSSCFPHMLYTIGEVTSKPGQSSKMKLFQKKKEQLTALGH